MGIAPFNIASSVILDYRATIGSASLRRIARQLSSYLKKLC